MAIKSKAVAVKKPSGKKDRKRAVRGTSLLAQCKRMFIVMVQEASTNKGKISEKTLTEAVKLEESIPKRQAVGIPPEVQRRLVMERLDEIYENNFSDSDEKELRRLLNRKNKLEAEIKRNNG